MKALRCLIAVSVIALIAACHRPLYSAAVESGPDHSLSQKRVAEGRATAIEQANYTKGYDPVTWQVIGHYRYFQKSEPSQTASNSEAAGELKIGTLGRDLIGGCGCSLQLLQDFRRKRERYVFICNLDEEPVMNIDGQNIRLEELEQSESPQGEARKGERHTERYRAGDLNVRIDYVVTGVCDPKDEGCEVTWYDATLTVTRGNQKKVVKAVGVCGC